MRSRLLTATVFTTTTLLSTTLVAADAAGATAATCRGEAATIVGAPDEALVGTEGRDVVVTNGAVTVTTAGGDDLVCVVGGRATTLSTGDGADVVDATGTPATVLSATLGAGADRFEGAATELRVRSGDVDSMGQWVDDAADVVLVASLADAEPFVVTGEVGRPNPDVVRLAGRGTVQWDGTMAPAGELSGGIGPNRLVAGLPEGDVALDLGAGTATNATATQSLRWSGFESHRFYSGESYLGPGPLTSVDITGSRDDDDVELSLLPSRAPITASMGAGDDEVTTTVPGARGSSYDGGRGTDRLGVAAWGAVDLDLGAGRLTTTHRSRTQRAAVDGFEDAHVWAREVRVAGDAGRNRLVASGCARSTVLARAGDDVVRHRADSPLDTRECGRTRPSVRFLGGAGRDRLVGSPRSDTLLGGGGHDAARGSSGRDVCEAERMSGCELQK